MNPDKIRSVLNILFMILALAAIIVYFVAKDDFKLFIYVCGAAIFVKLMEFFTNFLTLRGEYYALVLVACAELVAAGTEKGREQAHGH